MKFLMGMVFTVIFMPLFDSWIIGGIIGFTLGFLVFDEDKKKKRNKKKDDQ